MLTVNAIGAIVLGIIAVIFFILAFIFWVKREKFELLHIFFDIFGVACSLTAIALLSTNGFGTKYWELEQYDDLTITSIDSRSTVADETKLTSEFAVEVDGIDGVLISEDPRFLSLDEGDTVNLSCHWVWQYGSADIHTCKIND